MPLIPNANRLTVKLQLLSRAASRVSHLVTAKMIEVGCGVAEIPSPTESTSLEAGKMDEPGLRAETLATELRRRVNSSITAAGDEGLKDAIPHCPNFTQPPRPDRADGS